MDIQPSQLKEWIEFLGRPTLAVIMIFVLVVYRKTVVDFFETIFSWLKRK